MPRGEVFRVKAAGGRVTLGTVRAVVVVVWAALASAAVLRAPSSFPRPAWLFRRPASSGAEYDKLAVSCVAAIPETWKRCPLGAQLHASLIVRLVEPSTQYPRTS